MEQHVKDKILIQLTKNPHSILNLLNHTLNDTVIYQKSLPQKKLRPLHLAEQTPCVIARKPKLKAIYKQ